MERMIYRIEGVEWDGKGSLVLARKKFNVGLMAGPDGTPWDGPTHTGDHDCTSGWSVSIPMENGATMGVTLDVSDGLTLNLRTDGWPIDHADIGLWEAANLSDPITMFVQNNTIVPYSQYKSRLKSIDMMNWSSWRECEPEWAAEHIIRVSKMRVVQPWRMTPGRWLKSLRELAVS